MEHSGLLILFVLILLSAFFSASETALIALSHAKVRNLCDKKKRFSSFVKKLKADPNKLLITILIGNNIVNILASVYATVIFTKIFSSNSIGLITGIMTGLVLIFGEVVPKTLANKYASSFSLFVSPLLYMLSKILSPLVFILNLLVKLLERIVSSKNTVADELISEEELKAMVILGAEEGSIEEDEQELIENILEFNDILVSEVMSPRINIDALALSTTIEEAGEFILRHTHTRIPVYEKSLDHVVGVITVRDILQYLQNDQGNMRLEDIDLQKPFFVPETKKINELFKAFQNRRLHMAIVIDEYGGASGLVTMEDLLEEIVGEIIDEHDIELSSITKIGTSEWEIQGDVEIYRVNESLSITLPAPEHKPLAFLILQKLNRFPRQGEKIKINDFIFAVEKMEGKKIEMISVVKQRNK